MGDVVWKSLIGSGPLALVLGLACFTLWNALQAERKGRIDDLKALLGKNSKD